MKGTCLKCGCTHDTPCDIASGETCWWIDAQEDLCSACASQLMTDDYPISAETTLGELALVVRSLRCGLEACRLLFAQHQQALFQAAENEAARFVADGPRIEPDFDHLEERRIWTP